jgi:hypothetical protein
MKQLILLLLFVTTITTCSKQPANIVTVEDINEISILVFSSDKTREKILGVENVKKLREVMYLALLASVDNITNYDITRTIIPNSPYKYKNIYINDLLIGETIEKDLYRYVYDPLHPDAILEGTMYGYVKYPDIDRFIEEDIIVKILNILFAINQ